MSVEVVIGGWEHDCCGSALQPGDQVDWQLHTDEAGVRHETHHDQQVDDALTGWVEQLFAVASDGSRVAITRLPSGRALRGFDDHEDGTVTALDGAVVPEDRCHLFVAVVRPRIKGSPGPLS